MKFLEIAGIVLEIVGELFVAYAALRVNHRIMHEHKIDAKVINVMKIEQIFGIFGCFLMVSGLIILIFTILAS